MIVRIMRHGDAPTIEGMRQLSAKGIAEARTMGQWLSEQSLTDTILISPLLRAQQTATEVMAYFKHDFKKADESLLKPEADASLTIEYFQALEAESLLLISHMPLVVNLLEAWLPGAGRYFPTAAIAELEINDDSVELAQFITPADLSELKLG
ncbi:phosphohistidine phosphatase SixA [Kangiella sp. TOML190]|uniref:phosphohistidine phosphatase SixA n=1 Tax=Kangiella sp. TOML190 TaxID=2931351 RepID=UPI002040C372|nr:phosphohistidine phosphatase SixA [Kangiella sp. TOML190]